MSDDPVLPLVFSEPITTKRLTLRLMSLDDVDDVFSYQSRDEVTRYQLFDSRSRKQVIERVASNSLASTIAREGDYLQLGIEVQTDDGRPRIVGDLYFSLTSRENSRAEIGWSLHPDFQGQGYATEAAAAMLDLAFGRMRLHRVYAELDPRNLASVALCRRLGMREEAHFVQDLMFKGEWADTGVYAILREEWRGR